jgi:tRNA-specific 2-thiouridylase
VDYFVDEYSRGRTPNPCVQCNNWIKFGRLFDYADSIGAEYVATGHYAQLVERDGEHALLRGVDTAKDQSYVLAGIDRACLPRMLLPVGRYVKSEIRELAARAGLKVANKRESQEICFVTSGKHGDFVRARSAAATSGNFVTTDGTVVGSHSGIEAFTIGQRKGLGIALGEPHFVVRIDPATNNVVLGSREDLARGQLSASGANWLIAPPALPFEGLAQIRYNSSAKPARISPRGSDRFAVEFNEPASGVAPGQLCVVYNESRVLGGGWIE